jgi:hypothetical protein
VGSLKGKFMKLGFFSMSVNPIGKDWWQEMDEFDTPLYARGEWTDRTLKRDSMTLMTGKCSR